PFITKLNWRRRTCCTTRRCCFHGAQRLFSHGPTWRTATYLSSTSISKKNQFKFFDFLFKNHRKRSFVQNRSKDTARHGTTQHDTTRDGLVKATTPHNQSAPPEKNAAGSWGTSSNSKRTLNTKRQKSISKQGSSR
ncbi:unnamed protein product, partial [Ectocarpus sp. 12 AP-2014]